MRQKPARETLQCLMAILGCLTSLEALDIELQPKHAKCLNEDNSSKGSQEFPSLSTLRTLQTSVSASCIIRSCTKLEHLTLKVTEEENEKTDAITKLKSVIKGLPQLKSLSVHCHYGEVGEFFVDGKLVEQTNVAGADSVIGISKRQNDLLRLRLSLYYEARLRVSYTKNHLRVITY